MDGEEKDRWDHTGEDVDGQGAGRVFVCLLLYRALDRMLAINGIVEIDSGADVVIAGPAIGLGSRVDESRLVHVERT